MRVLLCVALISCLYIGSEALTKTCLSSATKAAPSTNTGVLAACSAYQNNSCCSADFTQQLAPPVKGVGNFSWLQCNQSRLSTRCEKYMLSVECFYRCSPNVAFWQNPSYKAGFLGAPLCAGFCDSWFDACKDDLTCADNWLTGFDTTSSGANQCKSPCKKFSEYYTNGAGLCSKQWGSSFKYTNATGECLNLDFTPGNNPNDALVENMFGKSTAMPATGTMAPTSAASTIKGLAGLLMGALAMFL